MSTIQLDQHGREVAFTDETPLEVYENLVGIVDDPSRVRVDSHPGFQHTQFEQDADTANINAIYRKADALQARAMETTFDPKTGEEKYVRPESSRRAFLLEAEQLRQSAAYDTVKAAQRKTVEAHYREEQTAAMQAALEAAEARRQEEARLAMMGPLARARAQLKIR